MWLAGSQPKTPRVFFTVWFHEAMSVGVASGAVFRTNPFGSPPWAWTGEGDSGPYRAQATSATAANPSGAARDPRRVRLLIGSILSYWGRGTKVYAFSNDACGRWSEGSEAVLGPWL